MNKHKRSVWLFLFNAFLHPLYSYQTKTEEAQTQQRQLFRLPPSLPVPAWEVAGDRARLGRNAGCGTLGTGGGGDSPKDAGSKGLPGILECWRFGMDLFKVWLL